MPIRPAKKLLNIIWYSMAMLIVLAALIVTIGREALPHVRLGNAMLSRYLSEQVGGEAIVTDLRGQWLKLLPELTARSVDIRTAHAHIQVENLRLEVNILESLLNRSLVFNRLQVDKANVSYTQTASNNTPIDLDELWRATYLLLNKNVNISNADITLKRTNRVYRFHVQDFRVADALLSKKVYLRLTGNDKAQLTAIGVVSGETLASSRGGFYINAVGWPLQDALSATDTLPPALQAWRDAAWHAQGKLWIDWHGTNSISSFIDLSVIRPPSQQKTPDTAIASIPNGIHTKLSANWQADGTSTIDLYALRLQKQANTLPVLENVRFKIQKSKPLHIETPQLTLGSLTALAEFLPRNGLHKLLTSLHPSGSLRNVDLLWDKNKPLAQRMQLRANADEISTGAWEGVPAFTQVSGYLESGIGYGFIDLASKNGFSMFYPTVYHNPMYFKQAAGRVQWQWQAEQKTVLVGSDYLSFSGEDGEVRGNFWLHLPVEHADFHSELYMAIGLRDSKAKYRDKYLPYTLPTNLLSWLKNSIGAANISEAGFIYRGPLSGHAPLSRAIQFYANINQGDVLFDPNWPRLTELDATILVDDTDTTVSARTGKIFDTKIERATVKVSPDHPGIIINVNACAQGPANDGLRLLRETPLHKQLGDAFDTWKITQGKINTILELQIPFAKAKKPPTEDVKITLKDTKLTLQNEHLEFDKLRGELAYDTHGGLSAKNLQAKLFSFPTTFDIRSKKTPKSLTVFIKANGGASAQTIADWSRLEPLKLLTGDLGYEAELILGPFGGRDSKRIARLSLHSDMQGIGIPLPYPFTKTIAEIKPLNLQANIYRNSIQDYELKYSNELSGAFRISNGELFGGELLVFDAAQSNTGKSNKKEAATPAFKQAKLPTQAGPLRIQGTLSSGDLDDWLTVVDDYKKLTKTNTNPHTYYPEFSFNFDHVTWHNLQFPYLSLNITHGQNQWRIGFNSIQAQGNIYIHDNNSVSDIVFNILTVSTPPAAPASNAAAHAETMAADTTDAAANASKKALLDNLNFADVPSLNLRIDQLFYNTWNVGSISLKLRSSPTELHIQDLRIKGQGFSVLGNNKDNDGAQLLWLRKPHQAEQTQFRGLLHMRGKQTTLRELGFDPFIIGKNIYVSADLTWPGTPLAMTATKLNGKINTRGEKGKYLQAKPTTAMRLLSIVNIATWVRRLRLDFSDLTQDGIVFDSYKGELSFNSGVMTLSDPLRIKSPSSSMVMSGKVFLISEQLDLRLTATLPVGNNATWITALAGGLPAAAGVYLASKIFSKQLDTLSSVTYRITGSMNNPNTAFERLAKPQQ